MWKTIVGTAFLVIGSTSQADDGRLYWAVQNLGEVWRADADGSNATQLIEPRDQNAIALDLSGEQLYYGENGDVLIADLNGNNRRLLLPGDGEIINLQLDTAGGWMYYIRRNATINGLFRAPIAGGPEDSLDTRATRGVALSIDDNWVFYRVNNTIVRADLDGSNPTTIITGVTPNISTIAAAPSTGQLFFSEPGRGGVQGIWRADFDGANVVRLIPTPEATTFSFGSVRVVGDQLYASKSDSLGVDDELVRFDLDGSNETSISVGDIVSGRFVLDLANTTAFVLDDGILRNRFDGSERRLLLSSIDSELHGIVVDDATREVCFPQPSRESNLIKIAAASSKVEATRITEVIFSSDPALGDVRGITQSSADGRIYWANTDDAPDGGVYSVLPDGSDFRTISGDADNPHDVAIDALTDTVYWSEGIADGDELFGQIRSANADGTNPQIVVTGLSERLRGVAVDGTNGKLYWTEQSSGTDGVIMRSDLDGSNIEPIVTGLNRPHHVALDVPGGVLYWTEGIGSGTTTGASIRRATLDGMNVVDIVPSLTQGVRDLHFAPGLPDELFTESFEQAAGPP